MIIGGKQRAVASPSVGVETRNETMSITDTVKATLLELSPNIVDKNA